MLITDPALMTNLSARHRQLLAERVSFCRSDITAHQASTDLTQKLLLTWPGGAAAETVMIPDADRRTACVSSQVGCPVGCKFCASGLNGVKGNLTAGQIVEQVYRLNLLLNPAGQRITNIVFMGMGEPLANYTNVMTAVRILHDPECFNIGARKITISTVGVPAKMRELANEELRSIWRSHCTPPTKSFASSSSRGPSISRWTTSSMPHVSISTAPAAR